MEESILARGLGTNIFTMGLLIGILTVLVFAYSLSSGGSLEYARTMALTTLITIQLLFSINCRRNDNGRSAPIRSNPWLVGALLVSFGLLVLVLYTPVLQTVFSTVSLEMGDWGIVMAASVLPFILRQVLKVFRL